jgi:tetratricopeptide (TPR) repeat protein
MAAILYRNLYEVDKETSNLQNCGLSLMLLRDYENALNCYKEIIQEKDTKYHSDSEYIDAGICCWCLSRHDEAMIWWKHSISVPYTDLAGGIVPLGILLFAALHNHDEKLIIDINNRITTMWKNYHKYSDTPSVDKTSDKKQDNESLLNWPGMIVPFILGKISFLDLNKGINALNNPRLRAQRECQAHFYNGVIAFRNEDYIMYEDEFNKSITNKKAILAHEYYLARHEIRK